MNVVWVRGMKVKFRCEDARAWLGRVVGGICGREPYPGRTRDSSEEFYEKQRQNAFQRERGGGQSDTGYALGNVSMKNRHAPGMEDPPPLSPASLGIRGNTPATRPPLRDGGGQCVAIGPDGRGRGREQDFGVGVHVDGREVVCSPAVRRWDIAPAGEGMETSPSPVARVSR